MTTVLSFSQLVTQVVSSADRPLALAEIKARVEMFRPVDTRNPQATLRTAIHNNRLIASLGGRPARYTWWPRHLTSSCFRQPLATSDLAAGTLVLDKEVWAALWPDFHGGSDRSQGDIVLVLAGGPTLQARIEHLVHGQAVWGLPPTPVLADWYRQQRATPEDELIVRVLDVDARRYAVELCRRSDRDEAAIAARDQALADAAEVVVRAGKPPLPYFDLIPRLIAQDAYRDPLPPDPWESVLRADLRFVIWKRSVFLANRTVDTLEREPEVPHDPGDSPRPQGNRRKVRTEETCQTWGAYLFDRGMDHRWAGWDMAAEAYYREALRIDPGHADAWVHLGNRRFEEGHVAEALGHYERAQAAAEARTIGDPAHYPGPFWLDVDSRPFMRALHGRALCLWRLEREDEARQVFSRMMELNPNDNQGVRFLLHDLDERLRWEESVAKEEEQRKREKAFWQAQRGRPGAGVDDLQGGLAICPDKGNTMPRRKQRARTSSAPQDDKFAWESLPNAVTLKRFSLLAPEMGELADQTLRQISPQVWERDRGKVEQIERADTPEALLELAAQASGLAEAPWLRRVQGYAPQIILLLAERLRRVRDVQNADQRTHLVENLITAFYVCGPESAAALLDCFPALDDYGKSLASAILGMLGARASTDTLWDFFNAIIDQPDENYFIGPLWGLVDMGDPRAADALAEVLDAGFFFFEAFAMAHRAGDARLVLPLLYAVRQGNKKVREGAGFALISIAHRIGRAAMLDALAPVGRDGNVTDANRAQLADGLLSYDQRWSEDYFAPFFEGMDASQVDPAEFRSRAEQLNQLEDSFSHRKPTRPGRNDPCWCGSGKKYKHCHLRHDRRQAK